MGNDDILKFRAGDLHAQVLEQAAERDVTVSQFLREAVTAYTNTGCSECGECDVCGLDQWAVEDMDMPKETAAIYGYGRFSETSNPEVQAVIDRAKELLREGAVGVSVAADLEPNDLPSDPADVTEEDIAAARQRNRHVAIVDTPAFSGAYLDLADDGNSVSGPLVFEGEITGDIRAIGPVGTMNIDDDSLLPMPIIFDIHEGDHTGMVVGYIEKLERVNGAATDGTAPLVASAGDYPAYLFSEPEPTAMTVHAPDKDGYRRYSGVIAPTGVCHKGKAGCYTYKGASLDYFHSGARISLDDGTVTRVGPLVMDGPHADANNLDYAAALARTDDARLVFAMGRMFHHPKGLLFSGVLMPDTDVMRVQATAPSVELWPDRRGKLEVKTALQVNRPAFPVAASIAGGGVQLTESEPVVVELESELIGDYHERMAVLEDRMLAVEKVTAELFATHLNNTL